MTTERERKQARERQRKRRKKQAENKRLREAILTMNWTDTMSVPGNPAKWYRFLVARGYMPPENDWAKLSAGMAAFIEEVITKSEEETELRWSFGVFKNKIKESPDDGDRPSDPTEIANPEELDGMSIRNGP